MALNILTLNVGRMLQERTRGYLSALTGPDVLLLQDLPYRDLSLLEYYPHVVFAPMTNHFINGVRAVVGVAVASRYFLTDVMHHTTWGDGLLKDLQGINDKNQRHLGAKSDVLVETSEDRVVICAKVVKGLEEYDVATTHGMWVRDGIVNDVQRHSTKLLRGALAKEVSRRGGLVFAADMNMARGGEIYRMLGETLRDEMPPEIENTLDPDHPYVKRGGKVVTDYVMTANRRTIYQVADVSLHPGVSDHCAVSATITK